MSTVFLLAGDEDLREGVAAAQRLGVQIVLLGIPTSNPNQSDPLVREADEVIVVGDDVLRAHFERAGVEPASPEQEPSTEEEGNDREAVAVEAAKTFARDWAGAADPSELAELLTRAPEIPKQLDVQLLLNSEEAAGFSLRGRQTLRHALRQAFWDELSGAGAAGATPGSSAPHEG